MTRDPVSIDKSERKEVEDSVEVSGKMEGVEIGNTQDHRNDDSGDVEMSTPQPLITAAMETAALDWLKRMLFYLRGSLIVQNGKN
jgi:hypothetical protein